MKASWTLVGTVGELIAAKDERVKEALNEATSNRWAFHRFGDVIKCYVCGEMQPLKDVRVVTCAHENGIMEYELQCAARFCPPPGYPARGQGAELQFPMPRSRDLSTDNLLDPDRLGALL